MYYGGAIHLDAVQTAELTGNQMCIRDRLITPVEEAGKYVNSIDKALYLSYEAYAQAASEGYHCYAMPITPLGTASNYEWGMSFMRYLANGKQAVSYTHLAAFYLEK